MPVDFDAGTLTSLVFPLCRLVATMAVSLVIAQALETFGWTAWIARLASPLVRFAHLSPVSGAAFSLSFASSASANALLGEGLAKGSIEKKELMLANIINSTPAFFLHLPSMLATAYAFLGSGAGSYVGLVFFAAALRTAGAVCVARALLPVREASTHRDEPKHRAGTFRIMLSRFRKRLTRICVFTVPVYCLVFILQKAGAFTAVEAFFAAHAGALFFLHPGSVGIVILFFVADSSAAFAAAASLIHGGTVSPEQAVLALLVGNIFSSPMRAFRHQLPSYAGFFSPRAALLLVGVNQSLRAVTLAVAAFLFYLTVAG
ncbi:hypothetical protein LJC26_08850 [Desulfovibrio sp. OttesenSCG-928-O18]|nr:hypothetical protein [Desulfovibrio sp. OttesenSCG-928-O18]